MLIRADVKCYYCGYVSGQIEGDPGSARSNWNFRSNAEVPSNARQRGRRIRCCRCGGPVFLDEVETVRQSIPLAEPSLAGVAR